MIFVIHKNRCNRRYVREKSLEKHRKIVDLRNKNGFNPKVGFYQWKCITDKKTGKYYFECNNYLSYPKNSKRQQCIKKRTSKYMRRVSLNELNGKGNFHHKYIDYWGELL